MSKATILIQDHVDQTYIDLDDILYVHVQKNYTYIHKTDGSESVHLTTLKDVMDKIDAVSDYSVSNFKQLGRSHIVNTAYVSKVEIKRRCITLQCNGRTIELKINSNKNQLLELGNLLKQQMTTDTLIKPRIQYTIDAETYDELCGQIIEIDGVDCVNLGLPSGRKWAIENLEAPLGDIPKMFAWGETRPRIKSEEDDYLFGKVGSMTKYTQTDGLKQLRPEDDAATCILGKKWRTPTIEDFRELMEHCTWKWCTWGIHHGCLVTSSNGNSIFLHAGGTAGINREYQGYYWTSSLNEIEDNLAYYCTFCEDIESEDAATLCYDEVEERYWAFYIRPVAD